MSNNKWISTNFKKTELISRRPVNMRIKVLSEEEKKELITSPIIGNLPEVSNSDNFSLSKFDSVSISKNSIIDEMDEHSGILNDILIEDIK